MATSSHSLPSPGRFRTFVWVNALFSVLIALLLIWTVYFHEASSAASGSSRLATLNAFLNSTSAVLLACALAAVKRARYRAHAALMIAAFLSSAIFLGNYLYYHFHHGDTPFRGTGWIRPLYFTVLITHIAASLAALPLVLASMSFAAFRWFALHRRISPYTWALWMYVSVTGVAVYLMLYHL